MVDTLIFDVDGTLIDSVDLHAAAWQEALAAFGFRSDYAAVRWQIGKGSDQLLPALVPKQELTPVRDKLVEFREKLFKEKYLPRAQAFPLVRELFLRLRVAGKRLALASSSKGELLKHHEKLARIEDLVDAETHADEVDESKPHPEIFERILEKLGNPHHERCVAIGDTPHDAIAAARAGLRCIGVLSGGFPAEALWESGVIGVYRDPGDLLAAYEREGDAMLTWHAPPAAAP